MHVRRGDMPLLPNSIIADVVEEIETAEIIIADLTGLNANVMYELGMAHARCQAVILLCRRGQTLPFDLASIRCIFYDVGAEDGSLTAGACLELKST